MKPTKIAFRVWIYSDQGEFLAVNLKKIERQTKWKKNRNTQQTQISCMCSKLKIARAVCVHTAQIRRICRQHSSRFAIALTHAEWTHFVYEYDSKKSWIVAKKKIKTLWTALLFHRLFPNIQSMWFWFDNASVYQYWLPYFWNSMTKTCWINFSFVYIYESPTIRNEILINRTTTLKTSNVIHCGNIRTQK